ncbi:MAG: class I SAM-dependent methyltransferase [Bacteroidales bacterium]
MSDTMVRYSCGYNRLAIEQERVHLRKAPISDIPFPDAMFDAILTVNTIYFWKNNMAVLSELKRVLKPGGRLTIGANSREEMVRRKYRKKYFSFFDREEIEQLVEENGLSVTSSFYTKLKIEDCIGVTAIKDL